MLRLLVLLLCLPVAIAQTPADVSHLKRAHAHNDYEHQRPLLDALDNGFCSVEADIFLVDGALLVGHTRQDLKPERTLQKLYLDPLRERVKERKGRVHADEPTFHLLIDVKTEAKATYAALAKVLAGYEGMLTTTKDGKAKPGAVTIVISGNCDRDAIAAGNPRHAAIDGRPKDLDGKDSAALVPWVSASWSSLFKWNGTGPMPEMERKLLKEYVAKAHTQGRLVRLWAAPDNADSWAIQYEAGVDLINTDKLPELRAFLLKRVE